jgi:hypothetical protein
VTFEEPVVISIPLGDYVGYCFTEAVKAREIADEYARRVAQEKSSQPGLSDFSTPRFRIGRLELALPMVVEDVDFQQTARFAADRDEFVEVVLARAEQARALAEQQLRPPLEAPADYPPPSIEVVSRPGRAATALHDQLAANPDPMNPDDIVRIGWAQVFDLACAESPLLVEHRDSDVIGKQREQSTRGVVELVRARTVLDRVQVEQLLISPLTEVVRTVGDPSCVLSVKAELVEEGFFLRQVQDSESGTTHTIVDFE